MTPRWDAARMTREQIETAVRVIYRDVLCYRYRPGGPLDISLDEIKMGTHYVSDLGAHSFDTVQMIKRVEKEFGVRIETEREEESLMTPATAAILLMSPAVKKQYE